MLVGIRKIFVKVIVPDWLLMNFRINCIHACDSASQNLGNSSNVIKTPSSVTFEYKSYKYDR